MSVSPDSGQQHAAAQTEDAKATLRRSLLDARCSLDDRLRTGWDQAIRDHVKTYLLAHPSLTLGVYFSTRNEPDLLELYALLSGNGISLSLPVVVGRTAALRFAKWIPGDPLVKDRFGISTPEKKTFVPTPETLLVPCLGFTKSGYRLGYGGGFFDRTLEQAPRPHTIGIAYACLMADFPVKAHDIAMDTIITESGPI